MKMQSNFQRNAGLLLAIVTGGLFAAKDVSAEILFEADSESASLSEWIFHSGEDGQSQMCCGRPGSYDYLTNDIANGGPASARAGNYFLKLTRTAGQPPARNFTSKGNKVVINHTDESAQEGYREERWTGFSLYVPGWFDTAAIAGINDGWNFLFGWHGKHAEEPTYLTVAFLHPNTLVIKSRSHQDDLHAVPYNWSTQVEINHYTMQMPRDQWVDFVFHTRIDERPLENGGTGFIKIWVNDAQVVDYNGPFGFKHANVGDIAGYLQVGNYTNDGYEHNRTYYYDEVRIGDSSASYSSVSPGTFGLPRPNPPILVSD